MHYLAGGDLEVPVGELVDGDGAVGGGDVDLGEEELDAVGDVEAVLVVDVVLGVVEVLPLRLGLGGRGGGDGEVGALPLAVFAALLDGGYEGIEGDGGMRGGG